MTIRKQPDAAAADCFAVSPAAVSSCAKAETQESSPRVRTTGHSSDGLS